MIKITSFSGGYCNVLFEVEPTRPAKIYETELGVAVTKNSSDYYLDPKNRKIYRSVTGVDMKCSVERLYEMKKDAQEDFSKRIHDLKKSLDKFKLLQELAKKKPAKKEE